ADGSSHRIVVSVADSMKTKSEWNRYDLGCGTASATLTISAQTYRSKLCTASRS
ncbi:hypothetical protein AVEN_172264-1, partial [Araneus ventricosus]